jgi:hypothetical protein
MNRLKQVIGVGVLLAALVAPLVAASNTAQAQDGPGWLQVWYVRGATRNQDAVEYRDATGTVLASYMMSNFQLPYWEFDAGWRLISNRTDSIAILDPATARINLYPPQGLLPSTDEV